MAVTGGVIAAYGSGQGGAKVTMAVAAAVTAGRVVEINGNMTVQHAAADSRKIIGIALQTASAVGDKIAVQLFGDVYYLTAQGAITAGDEVTVGAAGTGTVSTAAASGAAYVQAEANRARAIVGVALEAIADTATGRVMVTGA